MVASDSRIRQPNKMLAAIFTSSAIFIAALAGFVLWDLLPAEMDEGKSALFGNSIGAAGVALAAWFGFRGIQWQMQREQRDREEEARILSRAFAAELAGIAGLFDDKASKLETGYIARTALSGGSATIPTAPRLSAPVFDANRDKIGRLPAPLAHRLIMAHIALGSFDHTQRFEMQHHELVMQSLSWRQTANSLRNIAAGMFAFADQQSDWLAYASRGLEEGAANLLRQVHEREEWLRSRE